MVWANRSHTKVVRRNRQGLLTAVRLTKQFSRAIFERFPVKRATGLAMESKGAGPK